MPISGLVITLEKDPVAQARALEALARDARLELGAAFGERVPAVADTPTAAAAEDLVRTIAEEPGVAFVDVASVDISLDEEV